MEEIFTDIVRTEPELEKITLEGILSETRTRGLGTAYWRNPEEEDINVIIDFSTVVPSERHEMLENMPPGFLISPYENKNNLLHYFLKADFHFVFKSNRVKTINRGHLLTQEKSEDFLGSISRNFEKYDKESVFESSFPRYISERIEFEDLIRVSLEKIKQGHFHKVVPSRISEIHLSPDINIIAKFIDLCDRHPKAFVSLFSLPGNGLWIGASPELLIRISGQNTFHTSAVAGTQSGEDVIDLSEVAWRQKEIEEQAYVSRYIINCFKKIRLREFEEYGPRTIKAGGLLHLRTDYKVDLESVNFPNLGSVMLKLLHPTSAVCGMPREPAYSFLQENEKIDREFYSGYLGPVNLNSETSLYVNLRCARIHKRKAYLYAGAGVTQDSNPENEWNETELKMKTIKEVLLYQ